MPLSLVAQEALPALPPSPVFPQNTFNPFAWLERLDESHLFVLLLMAILTTGFVLVTMITTITNLLRSSRTSRLRADLIRDLLDRGFHASEIRDLVALTGDSSDLRAALQTPGETTPPRVSAPPQKQHLYPGPLN